MSSSPPGAPHSLASSAAGVWRVSTHRPSAMATRQASHSAAMVRTPSGASVARLRGVVVPVMVTDPVAQVEVGAGFIAAQGREIQKVVGAGQAFHAAFERRVGVEDLAVRVRVKGAGARAFFHAAIGLRHRGVEVEVEVAALGREPIEAPAHALFEGVQLGQRRARHRHHRYVVMAQVHQGAVQMVCQERAADAAFFPIRAVHEMPRGPPALWNW
ncbi:hypothetical protein G6F65_020162 [Rhizopus arrhizus]|nr:hypothetical protein G6F65_020162 [Rhizopus arrhizus]